MSANSSSSTNSSLDSALSDCFSFAVSNIMETAFHVTRAVLLAPLCILILYLAQQRLRQKRSLTAASHCDIFTYHLAFMELFGVFGTAFKLFGSSTGIKEIEIVGHCLYSIPYSGENFFHILTCVERYLAVVHPHSYMGLRNARGVRIRNYIIGCVWLLCFILLAVVGLSYPDIPTIPMSCLTFLSLVVISFCSLSVLCVLVRPGPGEGGQGKERVDQSKQKAFLTIMAILGTLCLWFAVILVAFALHASHLLSPNVQFLLFTCVSWFNLPCSLVLPLLYLQRAGKLPFSF